MCSTRGRGKRENFITGVDSNWGLRVNTFEFFESERFREKNYGRDLCTNREVMAGVAGIPISVVAVHFCSDFR